MSTGAMNYRALEMHGGTMWNEQAVRDAIAFIVDHDMDALVFHEGDVINQLVFPRAYFPPYSTWTAAPPRRGENAIYNARAYIERVGQRCRDSGIEFMLEVKELGFTDEVLEKFPDIMVEGVVCPTNPHWFEYLEIKYSELFEDFGDIAGVVVSAGSPEGRTALSYRRCPCERCEHTVQQDWYRDITSSIWRAAERFGRRIIVREFSYSPADQDAVLAGLDGVDDGVELCIKPYARDFYPTYPDNSALTAEPQRTKWLEYDVHGQFYGWGVVPCPIVADQRRRFQSATNAGVTALLMRAEWERINDLWALQTLNRVNIATGSLLAADPTMPARDALAQALATTGLVDQAVPTDDVAQIADALLEMWPLVEKCMFVRAYVFNSGSMIPDGLAYAWWNMTIKHKLQDWDPSAAHRLDVTSVEETAAMLAEKDDALADVDRVLDGVRFWVDRGALHLPDPCRVGDVLAFSRRYLVAFARCAKLVILASAAQRREGGLTAEEQALLVTEIAEARKVADDARVVVAEGQQSHQAKLLLDVDRIERIINDAEGYVTA